MAAITMLSSVLEANEIQKLDADCRTKLEEFVAESSRNVDALKEENAQLKARCEHSAFQLESALADHRQQLAAESEARDHLKKEVADLNSKLGECQAELQASKTALAAAKADLELTVKNLDQVSREKLELVGKLEKRAEEAASLNETVKRLTEELALANQQQRDQMVRMEELQLQEITSQHTERRLSQERDLLEKRAAELCEELHMVRQEVVQLRRDKTGVAMDLQAQLDEQKEAVRVLQTQLESWKSSSLEKDTRVEAQAARVRELQEAYAKLEEHFGQELQAQSKLTDLYKESDAAGKEHVEELVSTVEEMQRLLLQAQSQAKEREAALEQSHTQAQKLLAERDQACEELTKELELANKLLQDKVGVSGGDLETLFPVASATSRALGSGLSLTELVGEHFRQQQQLRLVLRERDALRQQLDELSREVADRVPLVSRHMEEYEKALQSVGTLREQLTTALVEQENLVQERDEARRVLAHAERQSQRWQLQCQDLSKQVCQLLKEVEDARGGYAAHALSSQEQEISSSEEGPPISAGEVISKHLVSFRDIEELQRKNVELLAVVRELSKKQEDEEKRAAEDRAGDLRGKLESVLGQLQELEQERSRQVALVTSLAQQRDMYRALVAQKNIKLPPELSAFEPLAASTPSSARPPPRASPEQTDQQAGKGAADDKAALLELQQEFDMFKKEMGENHR
ncbi:unnamed protein product [Ixodes hexagonus]